MCVRGAFFLLLGHVLFVGRVTLLDLNMFRELHPELNIVPRSPMATSVFLPIQNE